MDLTSLVKIDDYTWKLRQQDKMRVPGILYGCEGLIRAMDDKVLEQVRNVATLPGIVGASYAMPDAHWGYGFPIGGVAAFDPDERGIVSAGGVGFDISCGVRMMRTSLPIAALLPQKEALAEVLFHRIPAGMGRGGHLKLTPEQLDDVLLKGAKWAIERNFGDWKDLDFIEENGTMAGADPGCVSERAKVRQRDEVGTLGSGNHYLEVQEVVEIFAPTIAETYGLRTGDIVVSIHCGSRGLGHQIGTEYLAEMVDAATHFQITLPDRELACAPINSDVGRRYLGAMRAATNCALANRQVLGHLTQEIFAKFFPGTEFALLFDVSHNTCKVENHLVDGGVRKLFVHRKGATRAFGPGHPALPERYRPVGQPVLVGGSMGSDSYVLAGCAASEQQSFASACHGAGRSLSRHAALRQWRGRDVIERLAARNIIVHSGSMRGVAEEVPEAYKNIDDVVISCERANLAQRVARLTPHICIKG